MIKDLVVDRSAFDRIIAAGGYISVSDRQRAGRQRDPGPEGERRPRHGRGGLHRLRRLRGACARTRRRRCSRARRSRTSACCRKASRSGRRARIAMVAQANAELFGSCTNIGECEAVCPKEIKLEVIARMNRDFLKANWSGRGAALRDDAEEVGKKPLAGVRR